MQNMRTLEIVKAKGEAPSPCHHSRFEALNISMLILRVSLSQAILPTTTRHVHIHTRRIISSMKATHARGANKKLQTFTFTTTLRLFHVFTKFLFAARSYLTPPPCAKVHAMLCFFPSPPLLLSTFFVFP